MGNKWREASVIWGNLFLSPTTMLFFLMAADSALLGPNLSIIAQEFDFDDATRDTLLGGRMNLIFFACGIPAALIAALLSDTFYKSRSHIVVTSSAIAQLSCFCVWFIPLGPKSYHKLLVFRGICGAAVGCAGAIGTAIMTDTCENSLLSMSASTGGVVSALGVAAGQAVAGYNGPTKGWRYPFLLVGIVGLMASFGTFCFGLRPNPTETSNGLKSNPSDASEDSPVRPHPPNKSTSNFSITTSEGLPNCCAVLCCTPTIMLLLVASIIVGLPNSVIDAYWTDYYALLFFTERTAKTDWRFDAKWDVAVGLATDITVGVQIGRALGQVLGGVAGMMVMWKSSSETVSDGPYSKVCDSIGEGGGEEEEEERRKEEEIEANKVSDYSVLWICALIVLAYFCLPLPFLYTMLYAPIGKKNYWTKYWLTNFFGGLLNGFTEPLSKALLLSLAPDGLSGVVASVSTMASLLGKAIGPAWVAAMAYQHGRLVAFFDSFVVWFVAAIILLGLCCSTSRDYRKASEGQAYVNVKYHGSKGVSHGVKKGKVREQAAATRAADRRKKQEKMAEARKLDRVKHATDGKGSFQPIDCEDPDNP